MNDKTSTKDGYLYLVSRLREMLFDYSIDIYRVPLLCTPLLGYEFLETEREIRHGNSIPVKRLEPIKEELVSSFDKDEIVKEILSHEERAYVRRMLASVDNTRVLEGCRYLRGKIPLTRYYDTLIQELKRTASAPKEKKRLEGMLRKLPAILHFRGYSHEYLYYVFNGIDFSTVKSSQLESKLDELLDNFDFHSKKFDVYFAFNVSESSNAKLVDEIEKLFDGLKIIEFDQDDRFKEQKEHLISHGSYASDEIEIRVCRIEIESLDAYTAAKSASDLFDFGTRSFLLLLNESAPACLSECLVVERGNNKEAFPECRIQNYKLLKPRPALRERLVKQSHRSLAILFKRTHGGAEFDRLTKAIDLHNSSLTINNFQNSFLCLWTALEVVCNGSKTITQSLRTALELSYLSRVIEEIEQRLSRSCLTYLNDISDKHDISLNETIYSILFLSDWKSERESLYERLSGDPLTRNRCFIINSLSKGSKMFEHIQAYGKRVSWHIERMNRARNSIVHAGDMPLFLDSLGEHLHMYLDILMNMILSYFESGDYHYIEDILAAMGYEHEIYFNKLKRANLADYYELQWFIARQTV